MYLLNYDFLHFLHVCGMQKFSGKESNPCCGRDLSHSSDSARSITPRATKGPLEILFSILYFIIFYFIPRDH